MFTQNEAEYVSTREAARLLGVSQRTVRNLAGQQHLEVKTEGGGAATRLMVSLASVQRLRSTRRCTPH
ncbi:MAG TPA: helix-turn-helix domain-containing protein [Rubrobacteraceae bacterium]|nr:helix-turn-helix domain-containing protein [Rubrobacteraceae bacterium]